MQFLFLFLAPLFFGCDKENIVDNWKAPSIQFYTQEGQELVEVKNQNQFKINDYINFHDNDNANPIDNVRITGRSVCVTANESATFEKPVAHLPLQFKSIVSPRIFLIGSVADCEFELILKNPNHSTKTFRFSKSISSQELLSEINIPQTINYTDFQNTLITTTSAKTQVELYCEKFSSVVSVPTPRGITLNDLVLSDDTVFEDIPIQNYYPHQKCRIVLRGSDKTQWSYVLNLKFQKIRPQLKVHFGSAPFFLLDYKMDFSNPFQTKISFALKKQDFVFPAVCKGSCDRVKIPPRAQTFQGEVQFSNRSLVFKGSELYVIHLNPGDKLSVHVKIKGISNVMAGYSIVPYINPQGTGAYDLEYNYRSLQEIGTQPPVIIDKFL